MSNPSETPWWQTFFDEEYFSLWSKLFSAEQIAEEAERIWKLLELSEGSRVLDAPCGYGRLSRPLAERGANVLGVDQSKPLLKRAEADRGELPDERLRFVCQDLRIPLSESGFDAALNVFSSLGYGNEENDLALLKTLNRALKPQGLLFIETMHRDAVVATLARGARSPLRLPDGTLVIEEPEFDAVAGRVDTIWYWWGPSGGGRKSACLRVYTVTELVRLIERAGFRFHSAHAGCSPQPFQARGPEMGGRLGILAEKEEP